MGVANVLIGQPASAAQDVVRVWFRAGWFVVNGTSSSDAAPALEGAAAAAAAAIAAAAGAAVRVISTMFDCFPRRLRYLLLVVHVTSSKASKSSRTRSMQKKNQNPLSGPTRAGDRYRARK